MKIVVIGLRGIPNIQGGVETHCEELFPRLAKMGFEICLVRRSCYVHSSDKLEEYKGVRLKTIFTVHKKNLEAILHTFLAVIWAKSQKPDIVHIHAVGPAILTPLARFLGMKVVFTHHGPDYDRAKWGKVAKTILRLGEKWGTKYANEIIVISEVIRQSLMRKYNRLNSHLIFNGVNKRVFPKERFYLDKLNLKSREYIFTLGRFVEEKGFDLLINAYRDLAQDNFKLVIAGDADHEVPYSQKLKKLANDNDVILTGFIKGEELIQLFSNARLFVLPSFHEGLPISLLEAMSYQLPVIVSDIPANIQISLPQHNYFVTGDIESLKKCLRDQLRKPFEPVEYNMSPYDWDKIANQTAAIYRNMINPQE